MTLIEKYKQKIAWFQKKSGLSDYETLTTSSIKQIMSINKPIPDSVISFSKKQFQKIREIIVRPSNK